MPCWPGRMRRPLVICRRCHEDIHAGRATTRVDGQVQHITVEPQAAVRVAGTQQDPLPGGAALSLRHLSGEERPRGIGRRGLPGRQGA